ncbi:ABC transporter ATP-binding protein [Phytohabitans sp. ZYX-F-186]|uniref:ABC transporter ATP-binding protein n=1 Tax=Phytohabitans maris TaxID=3071409 RepID=A0ABU0ZD85_9ACTN|nr:ABC transporter ATP-binding protein [Phytohabitans sp. ZYX-F-186]MDQ7905025.1 ABC transporter ATP-binding protein [Phytohabitans sp. ZYX-F-186]
MIRTLLQLLPADRRRLAAGHAALTVLGVALRAAGAVLLVPLVADLFGPDPGGAWPWLGALAAVTAAGWAVDTAAARIGFDLGFALLDNGQHSIADRLTRIRLTWFTAAHTATARQAVATTGPDLVGLVIYLVTPVAGAVLLPVAIGLALLPISVPLGLAALAGVPVLLVAFWTTRRIGRVADRTAEDANTALTERIVEFARTQPALRAARRAEPARGLVGAALAAQHGATVRLVLLQIPGQLLFGLASQAALVLLAGTTTALAVRGDLGVPEAIALLVVVARYLEAFAALGELTPGIETATTALRRIRAVRDAPTVSIGASARPGTATGAPRIRLERVAFRYADDGPQVLDGLDLTLEAGTTTAIVGPSGSGKSTLLALLAGLHQPTAGRVLVDGDDTAALAPDERRALVSVVFQQPYLFDGTIRDNVLAGDPGAGEDRLGHAVALARVDEVTARLPDGERTAVGEAGTALSGGERQRVSIARALLKPAPILLVDEATSALDTENEAAVVQALADRTTPRTRVVVAHRLGSIRHADRVVFLEDGRVVEDGTVEGLLAAGGRFADFWRRREAATGWRVVSAGGSDT